MTIFMECLKCKTTVTNPRVMNMMYEMCNSCASIQRERENLAIDTFLHQEAEKGLNQNV